MNLNNIQTITDPDKRYDFMFLFDVQDGNPNGDPDAGNMPRVDPETMQGLVTDVCIKRKIRDFVDLSKGDEDRFKIYVEHKGILARQQMRAYKAINAEPQDSANEKARKWMCENFYDIRMFGAVMTTGKAASDENDKKSGTKKWNCGQVRGPLQITFARSVDPVTPLDVTITRVALTNEGDTGIESSEEGVAASGQIGRKAIMPYGLYIGKGFFSPKFADDTGVTSEDIELLWKAFVSMWDLDHSAARGFMSLRGLYVFKHDDPMGNAPAHTLFDRLNVARKNDVESARSFKDYNVDLDENDLPNGVTLTKVIG